MITKAEARARKFAERLESAGFTCEITVEQRPEMLYSDGEVMIPASVYVSVAADGPNRWDDRYGFSFRSYLPAKGHHATTRFCGGNRYRSFSKNFSKRLSLKQLGFAIAGEIDSARYRASQGA